MLKKALLLLIFISISLILVSCDGDFLENELKVRSSSRKSSVTSYTITVKAEAAGKIYDFFNPFPDPELTYTYSPDPLPQGISITGSLVRDPGELAGTYVIRQGTLELSGDNASKYKLVFVESFFKIYGN